MAAKMAEIFKITFQKISKMAAKMAENFKITRTKSKMTVDFHDQRFARNELGLDENL